MFFFGNLATGHLSGNFPPYVPSSDDAGSNDTGLMSVWPPGAESIAGHTHTHTELRYYNIDIYMKYTF
jgi:hypothetical protein